MANLFARSVIVLALLFGLFFAVGMGVLTYFGQPPILALGLALVVLVLQYLLGPWILELIFKIKWQDPDPELAEFIRQVCAARHVPAPRFGVIYDGNPNAFTFGHYPGDARLVVTTGLLEKLDERETRAVVAHELGHIVHWDFVVMTIAAIIPLVLYVLYISTRRRRRGGAYAVAISIASYIAYVVSQYVVLLLSRVREYYADQFAADVTRDPEALSRALVKIAYGLVGARPLPPPAESGDKKKKKPAPEGTSPRVMAARAFGIFDSKAASTMALSGIKDPDSRKFSPLAMASAMQWDLRNPWGMVYEISSTHPLPAKRIRALTRQAAHYGQPTHFKAFGAKSSQSYWGVFFEDLIMSAMPWIGMATGLVLASIMAASQNITGSVTAIGATVLLGSVGAWLKRAFSYRLEFDQPRTVRSLVGVIEVSGVRSIPCTLEGTIIGRGVPGLFYGEDLVLQDETGFIVIDYRQPFRILDFLFGWRRAEKLIGKRGRVVGWYRRTLRPYFEMRCIELDDGTVVNSYYYPFTQLFIYLGMIAGAVMLGLGLFL